MAKLILSSVFGYFKQLGHRLFLAYAHFRWRRWRRPWRYYGGRWYVIVDDDKMNDEKVEVLSWFYPEGGITEGVCIPLDDHDYFDYVPMEDRISVSQYWAMQEEYWAKRGGRPTFAEIIERRRKEFEEYLAKKAALASESNSAPGDGGSEDTEAPSRPWQAMWQKLRSGLRGFFPVETPR